MKVKYKGKIVEVVSVGELATMVGRKTDTLRKYELHGTIPLPNLRGKSFKDGTIGKRLYTKALALKLVPLFARIKQGEKVPADVSQQINVAFQEEKIYLETEV